MLSSTVGSSIITGWKRRSSALSFSMYLRYSSTVVAPIMRSSPRASRGLSMLPASTAPSAAPAPTTVCSSSMKRMMRPSDSVTSLSTALRRSSNSPRNFAPAISEPMSRENTVFSLSPSGTSPAAMRCAMPSTRAVLPTPGSPTSTGLFFVRRESTWMARRISSSLPMTGSSAPRRACSVRSRPKRLSAWYFSSGFWSVTRCEPRMPCSAVRMAFRSTPDDASRRPASVCPAAESASSRCSVLMNSSRKPCISCSAARKSFSSAGARWTRPDSPPYTFGFCSMLRCSSARSASRSLPIFRMTDTATPSASSSSAASRCSGSSC